MVNALVLSRHDYCNSLVDLPGNFAETLATCPQFCPRTFLNLPRRKPVRRHLKSLGWLPIPERTEFKVACLTYRCLNGLAPVHLSKLISPYTPERDLRSAGKNFIARDGDESSYLICHELLAIWYHLQHQSLGISQNKFIATLEEVSGEASRVSRIFLLL